MEKKNNKKYYTGKYDTVFKTIMCDEDNKHMMKEFLERLLGKNIEEVKFLRNELPVNNALEKGKTIDVLVKIDNEYIHIELNSQYKDYLHTRNFIYFSTVFIRKTKKGEKYDTTSKYIHIDLTYGMRFEKEDYNKYYIMANDGKKYIKNMEIIEYNMDKIKEYWYTKEEEKIEKYKHLIMLDLNKEELKSISKGDKFMEEYERKINRLNEDETFQSAMTKEEDQRLILNTEKDISKKEGIEQGSNKTKQEVVLNMLKKNIDIETISDVTGLSYSDILNLQN